MTQTIISIEKIDKGQKIAATCVHFGFCTAVCPTYVLDGEENDSPRGRIALIKEMLAKGGKPDQTTVKHVDRCLSCLSCATTCAAGVDYRTLVDTAREYIEASGVRPISERLKRKILAYAMTTPWLLRGLVHVAQPLNGVVGRLPGFIGALGRLSSAAGIKALAKRATSGPAVPSVLVNPIRKVALLDGCAQSAIGQEINDSTRRLLERLNVQVVPLNAKSPCCGALNLHLGYESKAVQQASVLVDGWSELLACNEIDSIIVTTSGCGSVIRHYRELFKQDPVRLERAIRVENASVDITQFLTEFTLPISNRHLGARVAYHDSCSLRHGQKIMSEPRKILENSGFKVLDIAESHLCCGSAGTYNILQPDIAHRLGQRKADNIKVTSSDVIAAGNIGCLMQISLFLQTPIAHVVQLIDWATGGPAPRGMELFNPVEQAAVAPEALIWSDETAPLSENTDSLW